MCIRDSGVTAPGLLALAQGMARFGEVSVLAPDHDWSGGGHVKTLRRPLRCLLYTSLGRSGTYCKPLGADAQIESRPVRCYSSRSYGNQTTCLLYTSKARVELFARNGAGMLPGAQQVVRWAAAKVPCALVTGSTRPEAELMLSALQVSSCFQVSFCAGEYASGKPSPEPYLRAATALACPPQRCIAVEDSVAGIASARAAGMTVIAVRAGNRYGQDQSAAHIAIDTLYDFESLFSPTR